MDESERHGGAKTDSCFFSYLCKRVVSSPAAAQHCFLCKGVRMLCYWSDRFYAEYHSSTVNKLASSQRNAFNVSVTWKFLLCFHNKIVAHVDVLQFLNRQKCNLVWLHILILFVFSVLLIVLFLGLELKVYFSLSLANFKAFFLCVWAALLNHPNIFCWYGMVWYGQYWVLGDNTLGIFIFFLSHVLLWCRENVHWSVCDVNRESKMVSIQYYCQILMYPVFYTVFSVVFLFLFTCFPFCWLWKFY